ncbi:hypothetical protein LguiB_035958 [Lonicera macranthoides]
MEPKARVSSRPPSLAFPLSDKGGEPLQAESDSESRTCPRSSKPASKSDRKAKPFLPIQAGEAVPISNHRSPRSHIGTFMMHHDQKAVKKTYASVWLTTLEQSSGPEVVAELAAEFRSEQDSLDEGNKNRLLAAAECFAHARRRSASKGQRLYDQRDQSARERGSSSSGETKSSLLLTEPSVRRSSSTCYEAPVFGGSPLLDLERRTSGQGKAQCAWCKWLSFIMIYQSEWRVLPTYMIDRRTT